jgi:hypothetical protein
MAIITQTEIINSVRVDDHFSVNNITDDTIQKGELYLSATYLGTTFYDEIEADKTGTGAFNETKYQTLYNKYLRRLLSEYILLITLDETIIRASNLGLNNDTQLDALKYAKESLKDEVERSKAMTTAFLINNKSDYLNFKENTTNNDNEPTQKKSMFGFLKEDLNNEYQYNRNNLI